MLKAQTIQIRTKGRQPKKQNRRGHVLEKESQVQEKGPDF